MHGLPLLSQEGGELPAQPAGLPEQEVHLQQRQRRFVPVGNHDNSPGKNTNTHAAVAAFTRFVARSPLTRGRTAVKDSLRLKMAGTMGLEVTACSGVCTKVSNRETTM